MQHAEKTSHNQRVYCAFMCRRYPFNSAKVAEKLILLNHDLLKRCIYKTKGK